MRAAPRGGGDRWCMVVVSSCREMLGQVPQRAQPLRPVASERDGHSGRTAGDNPEEGGDDVKSSCPLRPGLHTCYNGAHRGMRRSDPERTPEKAPQFGLQPATRLHEAGIASNRGSERRGEYVPGSCTHRPSHHGSRKCPKPAAQPAMEGAVEGRSGDWGEVVTR